MRYARSVPDLWVPLVMMAVVGTLSYNFQTVFPLFATRDLHGDGTTFTLLFSVVSVGALIGALRVGAAQDDQRARPSRMASLGFGVALALMAFAPNQAVAFPIGLLLGVASIAFLTASTAIVQIEAAPGDARPGARAAGDGVPRQHADRRPDRRLGVAGSSAPATAWASARSPRSAPARGGCCAPDGWPRRR